MKKFFGPIVALLLSGGLSTGMFVLCLQFSGPLPGAGKTVALVSFSTAALVVLLVGGLPPLLAAMQRRR